MEETTTPKRKHNFNCERLYPQTSCCAKNNLKKSSMRCMKPSVRNKGIMELVIYQ